MTKCDLNNDWPKIAWDQNGGNMLVLLCTSEKMYSSIFHHLKMGDEEPTDPHIKANTVIQPSRHKDVDYCFNALKE